MLVPTKTEDVKECNMGFAELSKSVHPANPKKVQNLLDRLEPDDRAALEGVLANKAYSNRQVYLLIKQAGEESERGDLPAELCDISAKTIEGFRVLLDGEVSGL